MSLHYAVHQHDLSSLSHLLKAKGENPNMVVYKTDRTALHEAATHDYVDCAALLLAYDANPNAVDYNSVTPLHLAVSAKMVQLLLRYNGNVTLANKFGNTPLHYAVSGDPETVKLLLENKADPNAINNNGHIPLETAITSGQFESTKLLLSHKANVHYANKLKRTVLFAAVAQQDQKSVDLLLQHGASVNVKGFLRNTPLHLAVRLFPQVVETLLMHGAIILVKNDDGETPMSLARESVNPSAARVLAKFEWEQRMLTFCQGLHPRVGRDSSIQRAWTADLSERNLIWLIGLFLKPSA